MQRRQLGAQGPVVSALGLGCMGMSIAYGQPDDAESSETIRRAVDRGVTLFATSDAYGNGANETLLGLALRGRQHGVLIATKFGNLALASRGGDGAAPALSGGHPDYVVQACDKSLQRLGVDVIDIYGLHRMDPLVPIEDTVGAMSRLVERGKVRYLQLSEAGPQTLRRAHAVHPIAALETEYSLWTRDVEAELLPLCRELGIGFMAYSPLGRGFLTAGIRTVDTLLPSDRRRDHPRFAADNLARNLALLGPLEAMAAAKGCTPAQLALAWLLAQGTDVVPIPGTKRRRTLDENLAGQAVELAAHELAALSAAFPPGVTQGTRYPAKQMASLGL